MEGWLRRGNIRCFDLKVSAQSLRDAVRDHAMLTARTAGVPVEHLERKSFRKDDRVAELLQQRGDAPGLVHVLSAMEACQAFKPWHDKATGRARLRPITGSVFTTTYTSCIQGWVWCMCVCRPARHHGRAGGRASDQQTEQSAAAKTANLQNLTIATPTRDAPASSMKNKRISSIAGACAGILLCFIASHGRADYSSSPLRLLFSRSQDLHDTWGKLHFVVTPIGLIREVGEPPFNPVGCFPLADGTWEVFGQELKELGRGKSSYQETNAWRISRATTRDGVLFDHRETVLEESAGPWTQHATIAFNPEAKEYLLLKLRMDSYGFAYMAFFSPDGRQWRAHPGNPLFYEGDAMTVFWSPALKRFVLVSKSLQPFRKHIRDHGGPTKSLKDDALRDRRVLMLRSSPDGRRWEPAESLPDVWDVHGQKGVHPPEWLTVPDADDPPDLEFYSGNGFWYYDRAYMMVLHYAASPLAPGKHAPHLDNEWWTSPDGLHWDRPARAVNALEVFPQVPRLEMPPMIIGGNLLWRRGKMLLGLPADRISGVSARANAEFSTKAFTMPDAELRLNAAVPAPDRPFARDQAYVMVAILDDQAQAIPGFEADQCVIREQNRTDIPLIWSKASTRQLAGKTVRLRFHLRSATIYAVNTSSPGK